MGYEVRKCLLIHLILNRMGNEIWTLSILTKSRQGRIWTLSRWTRSRILKNGDLVHFRLYPILDQWSMIRNTVKIILRYLIRTWILVLTFRKELDFVQIFSLNRDHEMFKADRFSRLSTRSRCGFVIDLVWTLSILFL